MARISETRTKVLSQEVLHPVTKDPVAGRFFEIRFTMTKHYQLVAWTDKGQVKMLPNVLQEYAQPYIDKIERQLAYYHEGWCEEYGRLAEQDVIALSRSFEAYGRFLLLHGKRQDAFEAFVDGARVCLDTRFEVDSEYGYVLVGILPKRYHYMRSLCLDMLNEDSSLSRLPKWQSMLKVFERLDAPFASERKKEQQEFRINRAFNFGGR